MNKILSTHNRDEELSQEIKHELSESIINKSEKSNLGNKNKINYRETKFQSIVDSCFDLVWEINQSFQFTYTNQAFRHCLGYSVSELNGKYIYNYMNKKERINEFMPNDENEDYMIFKNDFIRQDGAIMLFKTKCFLLVDEAGNTIGYQGISKEITEPIEPKDIKNDH